MSEGVNITVETAVTGRYTNADGVGAQADNLNLHPIIVFGSGSGWSECDALYEQQVVLGGNMTETLDLTNLVDPNGVALNFARVKFMAVTVDLTAQAGIAIGNAGSNPFAGPLNGTGVEHVQVGGFSVKASPQAAGWPVTSGAKALMVAADSSTLGTSGKIIIGGSRE